MLPILFFGILYLLSALIGSSIVSFADAKPFIFYTGFYVPFFGIGVIAASIIVIAFIIAMCCMLKIIFLDINEELKNITNKINKKLKL